MGRMNPERWPPRAWRMTAPTIDRMLELGWEVTARCRDCDLEILANLKLMIYLLGPKFSTWNRATPCRRFRCRGHMTFWCRPRQLSMPIEMRAPALDGVEER